MNNTKLLPVINEKAILRRKLEKEGNFSRKMLKN